MLKDKEGNRLFRKVTVKIIFPDNLFPNKVLNAHAGARQGFGPDGVDQILERIADQLDSLYPFWEFRPIELKAEGRTAKYVFTFAGYRDVPQPENIQEPGVKRAEERPRQTRVTEELLEKIKNFKPTEFPHMKLDLEQPTESKVLGPETAETNTPAQITVPAGNTSPEPLSQE